MYNADRPMMASDTIVEERCASPEKMADAASFNGPEDNPALKMCVPVMKCVIVRWVPSYTVNRSMGKAPIDDVSTTVISGCHEPSNKGTDSPSLVTSCSCHDECPDKETAVPAEALGRAKEFCFDSCVWPSLG